MADRFGAFVFVERRDEFAVGDPVPAPDEGADVVAQGHGVFLMVRVDFDAVAGAENDGAPPVEPVLKFAQGRGDGLRRKMEAFPQRERAGMMAESYRYDAHGEDSQKW